MKKLLLVLLSLLVLSVNVYADSKWACTGLTGGAAGALDALDITAASTPNAQNIVEGDSAEVKTISGTVVNTYSYIFDASGTDAESSPDVIRPDDYSTAGVWRLTSPVLASDDNYVTDAEKTVLGNTSGTNTGDDPADDTAYNATSWDANTDAATKNAIRDKIETMGSGYTNLTSFVDQTAWRLFYSNTAGDVTELAFGVPNTFLGSDGTTSAPSFQGLVDADIPDDITINEATSALSVVAVANNTTDETVYPLFAGGATGTQGAETDTGWTYNPSTEVMTVGSVQTDPSATPGVLAKDSGNPGTTTEDKEIGKLYWDYVDGLEDFENGDSFWQVMQNGSHTTFVQIDESDDQVEFLKNTSFQSNDIIASEFADLYAYQEIPIAWMKDGTSAPATLDDGTTRSPYAYRAFDSVADEDLNFVWVVPADLSGTTIQFRVYYLVTSATGPSATEGVAFGLSGVSAGDNDATNGTKGTVVVITDDTLNAAQHDVLITGWSGDVTITSLAVGEVAELALIRDVSDAVDDYGQDVGVFMVQLRYVKNPAR